MRSTLWVALSNPDAWWGFHLDSYVKPPDHGYRCRDRAIYFSLARMDPEKLDALLRDLDMEWVKDDPLFPLLANDTAGGTGRHAHVVKPLWERAFARLDADLVMEIVERHGGLCFPASDYQMLVNDPQVEHMEFLRTVEQPGTGTMRVVAPPWRFADTLAEIRLPAPRLGEHTATILEEMGYAASAVDRLGGRTAHG
jgi:crotonobetainyl-CoA:carnitine CoA-transferase CaiB-like acyl-CoA transferase